MLSKSFHIPKADYEDGFGKVNCMTISGTGGFSFPY